MSAYIVDRETIQYLVQSGLEAAYQHHFGRTMRWYHDGESHCLDGGNASDVGQMLWEENIRSVAYLQRDSILDGLPGPVGETFIYSHYTVYYRWDSSAKAFIDLLRKLAWTTVPGYDEAEWGHPTWAKASRPTA